MSSSKDPNSLSKTLAGWQVNPPRNPQFRAAVWARIEAAHQPSTWSKFARAHATLVGTLLFTAVAAGAWTGRVEAREQMKADRTAIAASYVHSLDARWMRHP